MKEPRKQIEIQNRCSKIKAATVKSYAISFEILKKLIF